MARKSGSVTWSKQRTAEYAEALGRLEITQDQLDFAPKMDHLFEAIGGREKAFEFLSFSEEGEVRTIFQLRARLTKSQKRDVPLEAYAIAAGMSPKRLFGFISQELMDQSMKMSAMIARLAHPELVQDSIKFASKPAGIKDREMIHKAVGFLPTPKNHFTVVNGDQHVSRAQVNMAVLPPLESVSRDLSQRFIDVAPVAPQLPAPAENDDEDA